MLWTEDKEQGAVGWPKDRALEVVNALDGKYPDHTVRARWLGGGPYSELWDVMVTRADWMLGMSCNFVRFLQSDSDVAAFEASMEVEK